MIIRKDGWRIRNDFRLIYVKKMEEDHQIMQRSLIAILYLEVNRLRKMGHVSAEVDSQFIIYYYFTML